MLVFNRNQLLWKNLVCNFASSSKCSLFDRESGQLWVSNFSLVSKLRASWWLQLFFFICFAFPWLHATSRIFELFCIARAQPLQCTSIIRPLPSSIYLSVCWHSLWAQMKNKVCIAIELKKTEIYNLFGLLQFSSLCNWATSTIIQLLYICSFLLSSLNQKYIFKELVFIWG